MKKLFPFLAMLVATTISAQQDNSIFWDTFPEPRIATPSKIEGWASTFNSYKTCKLSFCVEDDVVFSVEDSIRVNIGLLFAESVVMQKAAQRGVLYFLIEKTQQPGWYYDFYQSKLLIILRVMQAQELAEGRKAEAEEIRELTNRLFPNQ
jgi:hypothetical protein